MPSNNDIENGSIAVTSQAFKKDLPVLNLNIVKKTQDLETNTEHRDCSSLGKVFRDIRQWEMNRVQKRRQQGGIGALAFVFILCGITGIYMGAWLVSTFFFICSAIATGYLPMISSPQPPATLRFLPDRLSPRPQSPQTGPLHSHIPNTVINQKITEGSGGVAHSSEVTNVLRTTISSQPVDNFPSPVLRFSSPEKSKTDTFDIVAQGKLCSTTKTDPVCRLK